MSLTSSDGARVTVDNIRVPRDEFVEVWHEAGRREAELARRQVSDGYLSAVVQTCRWMAAVPPRTALCGGQTRSPVTMRSCRARPELIEAECRAAVHGREQFCADVAGRPGWCEGVRATFRWAWLGHGARPIEVRLARHPG